MMVDIVGQMAWLRIQSWEVWDTDGDIHAPYSLLPVGITLLKADQPTDEPIDRDGNHQSRMLDESYTNAILETSRWEPTRTR